jgi:hypothetical protein
MGHAYGEDRPLIHYDGARLLGIRQGEALLRVRLRVTNPGRKEIPVTYGRLNLRLAHHPIGYGTLPPTRFPAREEKTVTVPVALSMSALGGVLQDLFSQSWLPWSAQGYANLAGPRIHIDEKGQIQSAELAPLLEKLVMGEG